MILNFILVKNLEVWACLLIYGSTLCIFSYLQQSTQ